MNGMGQQGHIFLFKLVDFVRLIREIIWLVSYASYIKSPDYSKPGNRGWGERWVGQLFDWCCPRADESALGPTWRHPHSSSRIRVRKQ
jgi:hypothetical protein